MKNKPLFILFLLILCSCQSNLEEEQMLKNYIAIDIKGRYANELSLEEENLYFEARDRFSTIVGCREHTFYLLSDNCEDINISPALFEHFKEIMERSNEYYNNLSKAQQEKLNCYSMKITQPKTKTRTEIPSSGESGFVRDWYGFDIYLSNMDLQKISLGATATSIIAMYIPDPAISKAVSAACGLAGVLAQYGALTCPNGIVISFAFPAPVAGGCVPFSISKR